MVADLYEVVSAGVDWITCTAKATEHSIKMDCFAQAELDGQARSGIKLIPQTRHGFQGSAGEHFFFGRREHDVMVQASGALADSLSERLIPLASNVSRLDLQVTLFTEGHVVHLATDTWAHLKQVPNGEGRPRSFSVIVGHPHGQTLYVNSRSSDNYGRIYDKGVESKCGPAGLLWRYEVELKRKVAKQHALALGGTHSSEAYAITQVHSWMTARGVLPPWAPACTLPSKCGQLQVSSADVLSWFNDSVSISVAKAVKRYGLPAVLASLGLHKLVQPKEG